MDDIFTYREAKPYLQRTKRMLKSVRSLENYINDTKRDLFEIAKIARKSSKKTAILAFVKKTKGDFETEYDNYLQKTEAALARAEHLYHKITEAHAAIQNEMVRDILQYYYMDEHTIEDTAEHFAFSVSSISRYKKSGLIKMTESLFGIIIDEKFDAALRLQIS